MGVIRILKLLVLLISLASYGYGQTFSITGIVKDKNETLPGASVYLASTKIGTATDSQGHFKLTNLPPGNYDLLVQMVGYQPQRKTVNLTEKSQHVIVQLTENITQLKEVGVTANSNREMYLAWFRQQFIGNAENAKNCRILNPQVLRIKFDKQENTLFVNGLDFLEIENKALGYRIKYLLKAFEYHRSKNMVYYEGYSFFEDLPGKKNKIRKWQNARQSAYLGSRMHFYRSLFDDKTQAEGFTINKLVSIPNPSRLPDSIIAAQIKKHAAKNNGMMTLSFTKSDSLAYYLRQRSMSKTMQVLNRTPISTDTLLKRMHNNQSQINFDNSLYIVYKGKPETGFSLSGFAVATPLDLANKQISTIKIIKAPLVFFSSGELDNPRNSIYGGYWSYKKIADHLPLDYQPPH